jgi:hypothetical protein
VGSKQPVLQVGTLHDEQVAQFAALHQAARLLDKRVHADVEVDCVDQSLLCRQLDQFRRLGRVHRKRLLADNVLASQKGGLGMRVVQIIGRSQVHYVDVGVGQHLIQ